MELFVEPRLHAKQAATQELVAEGSGSGAPDASALSRKREFERVLMALCQQELADTSEAAGLAGTRAASNPLRLT